MAAKQANLVGKIFKDKHGKLVLWQRPNLPLWGWIVCTVLGLLFKHGNLHNGLHHLGEASLFAWAYLEIRSGASMFRRILGVIVMAIIVYGFFAH